MRQSGPIEASVRALLAPVLASKTLEHQLAEPLLESAPIAFRTAMTGCVPGDRGSCRAYHAVWQYLRLAGSTRSVKVDGALYVAEVHRIIRFPNIESQLSQPPPIEVIAEYPKDTHHGWKFMALGPDGRLYIPQGAPP